MKCEVISSRLEREYRLFGVHLPQTSCQFWVFSPVVTLQSWTVSWSWVSRQRGKCNPVSLKSWYKKKKQNHSPLPELSQANEKPRRVSVKLKIGASPRQQPQVITMTTRCGQNNSWILQNTHTKKIEQKTNKQWASSGSSGSTFEADRVPEKPSFLLKTVLATFWLSSGSSETSPHWPASPVNRERQTTAPLLLLSLPHRGRQSTIFSNHNTQCPP